MALNETEFDMIADKVLARCLDRIEETLGGDLDVDLEGGVLTVELDSGAVYVINKHAPNKQIWMSSPMSGASHFNYDADGGLWRATRSDDVLNELLAAELYKLTGKTVML